MKPSGLLVNEHAQTHNLLNSGGANLPMAWVKFTHEAVKFGEKALVKSLRTKGFTLSLV